MSTAETTTEIRPFHLEIPDEQLAELRRRIEATRWPSGELVDDRSQGVQLATMRELARFWTTEYDWRACEARLGVVELPGSLLWKPDGSLVNWALRVAAARRAPSLIERTGG